MSDLGYLYNVTILWDRSLQIFAVDKFHGDPTVEPEQCLHEIYG